MQSAECRRLLEVSAQASREEIRSAYRRAVKRLHPDVHPAADPGGEEFRRLVQAYQLLLRQVRERPATLPAEAEPQAPPRSYAEAAARSFRRAGPPRRRPPVSSALVRRLDRLPLEELVERFQVSRSFAVQAAAAHALARRRDPLALRALLCGLSAAGEDGLRIEIIRSLGECRSRRAVYWLARLLASANPEVAREARAALRRIDPPFAQRLLLFLRIPRWLRALFRVA